jgi:hypothetical protein
MQHGGKAPQNIFKKLSGQNVGGKKHYFVYLNFLGL